MKHDGRRILWHRELADTSLQIAAFRRRPRAATSSSSTTAAGSIASSPAPKTEPAAPFPTLLSQTGLFASTARASARSRAHPLLRERARLERRRRGRAIPGGARRGEGRLRRRAAAGHSPTAPPSSRRSRSNASRASRRRGPGRDAGARSASRASGPAIPTAGTPSRPTPRSWRRAARTPSSATAGGDPGRKWRFPGRSECMACHSRAANFVLGVTGSQLNRDHDYGGVRDNQLRTLDHIGLFAGALPEAPKDLDRLVDPRDDVRRPRRRAPDVPARQLLGLPRRGRRAATRRWSWPSRTPREKMNLLGARPQHDTFGLANAMLVAPGDPDRSVLLHRLSRRGPRPDAAAGVEPRRRAGRRAAPRLDRRAQARATVRPGLADGRPAPRPRPAGPGRSVDRGRKAFRDTGCLQCHRFEGEGGSVGPDLAGVARRLAPSDLLESILVPSKVIADEYAEYSDRDRRRLGRLRPGRARGRPRRRAPPAAAGRGRHRREGRDRRAAAVGPVQHAGGDRQRPPEGADPRPAGLSPRRPPAQGARSHDDRHSTAGRVVRIARGLRSSSGSCRRPPPRPTSRPPGAWRPW